VAAVGEVKRAVRPDQPQVGLVDQGGGVERLAGLFLGHVSGGQPAQLVIDHWEQLGDGLFVAGLDGVQDPRDLTHAR
jgi:hypothetical protein